jgi:hypothetical protein
MYDDFGVNHHFRGRPSTVDENRAPQIGRDFTQH